jgi:TonB-linked SusC/RagA family outer membrane protein
MNKLIRKDTICFFFTTKNIRSIKWICFMAVFFVFQSAVGAYAQRAGIDLNMRQSTLKEVFKEIESQTEFTFFYNDEALDPDRIVDVHVRNETVEGVLDKMLLNCTYRIENKNILLIPKDTDISQDTQQDKRKITGTVVDEYGEPVAGANVMEKGSTNGITTDVEGKFSLFVAENAILQISYIGYVGQEIGVKNQLHIQTTMKEDLRKLDEIVIVGYGTVKRRDLTGAVSQLSSNKIQNQAVFKDPIQALQGKIAGADITLGNAPGSSSQIYIRGYNSLNASNDPLIVVDDAPFGGKIDEINPAEIESIDVLKDASSTAIYGARGANGVIIITTKRARKDSRLSVRYDGYYGISKSLKNYDMMSGEKYADYKRMANYGKTDGEIFDDIQLNALSTGQFVDWQDLMFSGMGYKTDHNVSINQSAGKNRNMIVLGYNKDQSIIDNMGYERFSARINGDMELHSNVTVGYSSLLALTTRDNGENGVWMYGTTLDPLTKVYGDDGKMLFYNSGWYQTVLHSNPMFDTQKENVDSKNKRSRVLLSLYADWKIIDGLKFRTSLTYDLSSIETGQYNSPTSQARQLASPSATYQKEAEKQWTFTNIFNYKKIVGVHGIDVSAVHDMQSYEYGVVGLSGQDMPYFGSWYNVNEAPDVFTRISSVRQWALLSFMGRINYSFKDKYLLTLTGRYDGSSRLAEGNKWDFFPSAALAWRMKEEDFLKDAGFLTNLKLRLSWGNSGNTAIPEYRTLGALGKYVYYFGKNEQSAMGYLPTELANNLLRWEKTEELNVGVDFGFINNRIGGTLDLYQRNTHELLMQRNLPYSSGYGSTWQNIGKTRNTGIELTFNLVPIVMKDLKWTVDINFAYNKNEIVELFNGKEDSPGNKWFIGKPFYVERLYKYTGVWQTEEAGEASKYGRTPGEPKILDVNNNYAYDDSDRFIYNKIPKWTGGLSTGVFYKNFDLNIYLYTRQNYGQTLPMLTNEAGSTRYNHINVDFWTPDNPTNASPKPRITNPQDLLVQSDYAFRDLSFVRLKNVNVGYTFSKSVIRKFHTDHLRIYFMVDNPYVWTRNDYPGLDPENCNDYYHHRPLTSFIFGVNLGF